MIKIIVDANIIFSGILNTNGKIGDLLINSGESFNFIAPDFLRTEISNKYTRLSKISGMSKSDIIEAEYQICKAITFISEEQIDLKNWLAAEKLVEGIDPNDTHYVAYSKQFKCNIWSGDKRLSKGLLKKGFNKILSTEELFQLRQSKS